MLTRPDGSRVPVDVTLRAVPDGVLLAFLRDATSRRVLESELRESDIRLRAIFDHSFQFMGLLDPAGTLIEANPAAVQFTGRPASEIFGKPFWDTPWWTHAPGAQAQLRDAVARAARGETVRFETTHPRPDGSLIDVDFSLRPVRDATGRVVYLVPEGHDITAQRQTERALKASVAEARALLAAIPDAVFTIHRDGTLLSHHAPPGSGVGPEVREFVGLTIADVVARESVEPCMACIARTLETGAQQQMDFTFVGEGVPRLFDARIAPKDATTVLALVRDVTARREFEERLRKIASQVPGMVYQYQLFPDGRSCFPYASEGIRQIYRVAPEDVREDATPVFDTLHPDDYDRVAASIAESSETLLPWQCEYRVRFADGVEQWLFGNSTPERLPDGSTIWHGFITDITGRKLADDRFRQSEARFRSYFDMGHSGMAIGDADGRWIEVNDRLCAMLGRSRGELQETNWRDVTHPDDIGPSLEPFEAMRAGRSDHYTLEKRFIREDGRVVPTSLTVRAVRRGDGSLDHTVATITDLTDRVAAEEERLALERRLLHAQKLESLGVMAGGIAHDFNNLLTAILGNLELALLDAPEGSRARMGMERAAQASRRAADLTRQMLAYSGKAQFVTRELDLNAFVEENAHLFRAATSKTVDFHLALAPGLPATLGDPGQVQQVVMNLITNASEALGERTGVVTLRTGFGAYGEAELSRSRLEDKPPPGDFVHLEVEDDGCGMDKATLDRLFDPFFTTKFTGRGLGMSAVLGIVRAHRGAITVDSAPGRGTRVRVLFPAAGAPATTAPGPVDARGVASTAAPRHETVLVVDDETMVRELCKAMVVRLGYAVLTAADGEEALRTLAAAPGGVQLVVLDYAMPRMHGLAALREIRKRWPDVRVVLSSGYSDADALAHADDAAPDAFMHKPYTFQALRDTLARLSQASL